MRIQCNDESVLAYEHTRQWVWLPRPAYKPPCALTGFKVKNSWMGRVTLRNREYPSFLLNGNGSELYIYTQEAMPGLLTYHWYIGSTTRALIRGVADRLEYAAEEL